MWVFHVLQALHAGLENYLSPDNFTLCCLGFFWVFQQKWVQRDVDSALPRAYEYWAGSPAMEEPAQPEEVTVPFYQGCHIT